MNTITKVFFACAIILTAFSCKGPNGEKAETAPAAKVDIATEVVGTKYPTEASSVISWEGSKPTGKHSGTISISAGSVNVNKGNVTGGSFIIDMNSIKCTDLEGDQAGYLEGHLKGLDPDGKNADDFFNVNKYPNGKFEITKVANVVNDENASHLIYGNLTLKETTKEIGFKANIEVTENGVTVTSPAFTIDRTQWGINYGSPTVFDNLKEKFIHNDISLSLNVTAK